MIEGRGFRVLKVLCPGTMGKAQGRMFHGSQCIVQE